MGKGTEALTKDADGFLWSLDEEPHLSRRKAMLAKYPEIKQLFGYEPRTKYIVVAMVAVQLYLAITLRDELFSLKFWVLAYVVGATVTQALFLAIHEVSHHLAFRSFGVNKLFNMFANLPIGLPYCVSFKGYHVEHHRYQGVVGVDTDLPTALEGRLVQGTLSKLLFCCFQIFFYAVRPMLVRAQTFTTEHALNWVVQFSFNTWLVYTYGWGPLVYLAVSDILAGSLHPCAAHFIAEHYVMVGEQETYSYYGPLNYLCFNVGYHVEHHDFPNIAWSRLPEVRKIAPEYYNNRHVHESWPAVMWWFITTPGVTALNRVKRAR